MKLRIVKTDPTNNYTILVLSPVPPEERARVSAALMALDGGWAEQVGFVSVLPDGTDRLDMMGGEFCGNAALSLAAYLAEKRGLEEQETAISVSGAPEAVRCAVRREGGSWTGTVTMPLPLSVREERRAFGDRESHLWTARFPGITHVLVPAGEMSGEDAERAVRQWIREDDGDALGLLLFSEATGSMRPLVCVSATGSAVWERGCASGAAAAGACLAVRNGGGVAMDVTQPGGRIGVLARAEEGAVEAVSVTGGVRLLGECDAIV